MKITSRKVLSFILTLTILLSTAPTNASAASFSDVPSGIWYYNDVYSLANKGIIGGTGNGKFSPNSNLSRAEIAAILTRLAITETDAVQYKGFSYFNDVDKNAWYAKYINWAYEAGVISGYGGGKFKPTQSVTRQELAKMIVNFSSAMWYTLPPKNGSVTFKDQSKIASFALSSVQTCQKAGVINGADGYFYPSGNAKRSEAAAMINRFILSYKKGANYTVYRKKIWGYSAKYVEFDPALFSSGIIMANNRVNGGESAGNMVSRTGAKIAVNAAYFNMNNYSPNATIITDGEIYTIDNMYAPHKPSFVVNSSGKASIENFKLVRIATLEKENGTSYKLESALSMNKFPSGATDASRILYTRRWGSSVGIYGTDAIAVDKNGIIIEKAAHMDNINIPEGGYVIYQRARREYEGEFFDSCAVGDRISLDTTYEGATTGNIQTAVAAGPRIVKNGSVYGSTSTYNQEGFWAGDITNAYAKRVAIGIKADGKVVILTTDCTMSKLSEILLSAGCKEAINLDGGGSTGIYIDGKWLVSPNRQLNNMIYFK